MPQGLRTWEQLVVRGIFPEKCDGSVLKLKASISLEDFTVSKWEADAFFEISDNSSNQDMPDKRSVQVSSQSGGQTRSIDVNIKLGIYVSSFNLVTN